MSTTLILGGTARAARRYATALLPADAPVTVVFPGEQQTDQYPDEWVTVRAELLDSVSD